MPSGRILVAWEDTKMQWVRIQPFKNLRRHEKHFHISKYKCFIYSTVISSKSHLIIFLVSNLAYGGSVNQSLSPVPKPPHPWIDGNFSNVYNLTNVIDKKGSVWWAVDLKAIHFVTNIYLHLSKYVAKGKLFWFWFWVN